MVQVGSQLACTQLHTREHATLENPGDRAVRRCIANCFDCLRSLVPLWHREISQRDEGKVRSRPWRPGQEHQVRLVAWGVSGWEDGRFAKQPLYHAGRAYVGATWWSTSSASPGLSLDALGMLCMGWRRASIAGTPGQIKMQSRFLAVVVGPDSNLQWLWPQLAAAVLWVRVSTWCKLN